MMSEFLEGEIDEFSLQYSYIIQLNDKVYLIQLKII